MTKSEFATAMAVLTSAIGKAMPERQAAVYFDLLGDLPLDVLQAAVRRILLEHEISTIPTVAEIRRLADEILHPERMTGAEAWELVRAAVRKFGWYRPAEGIGSLPGEVAAFTSGFGWDAICNSEQIDFTRGSFVKMFDSRSEAARRQALLPDALKQQIAAIQAKRLPQSPPPRITARDPEPVGQILKLKR